MEGHKSVIGDRNGNLGVGTELSILQISYAHFPLSHISSP